MLSGVGCIEATILEATMTTKSIDTGAEACLAERPYDEVAAAYMLGARPRRARDPVQAKCPGCGDPGPHENGTDIYGLAATCCSCGMFFDVIERDGRRGR